MVAHAGEGTVPADELPYYGYPRDEERFVALADSNGCAAGPTLVEACRQGLYELIERDSVALWWYNRIRRPGVVMEGLEPAWLDELRSFYDAPGENSGCSTSRAISRFRASRRSADGWALRPKRPKTS